MANELKTVEVGDFGPFVGAKLLLSQARANDKSNGRGSPWVALDEAYESSLETLRSAFEIAGQALGLSTDWSKDPSKRVTNWDLAHDSIILKLPKRRKSKPKSASKPKKKKKAKSKSVRSRKRSG